MRYQRLHAAFEGSSSQLGRDVGLLSMLAALVRRVAGETGFYDLSHFTRHFKRHIGVAPGGYAADRKNVHYDAP